MTCSEASSGRLEVGQYALHDMIQLDRQSVGVIVRIERGACKVMDTTGTVQTVRLQAMGRKRMSSGGLDRHQNRLSPNDMVTVLEGKFKVCPRVRVGGRVKAHCSIRVDKEPYGTSFDTTLSCIPNRSCRTAGYLW